MLSNNIRAQLDLLPEFFSHHLSLSLASLAIGITISLPLAVLASRRKGLESAVLGTASVIQTIPSLALLALMVPLLGAIGFWPALIALVLYSMLPILRNTVTGLAGVDPALIEAADGLGMSPWQRLWRVELPLAAPSIIAGIRTATVWVVGIATLATPVGQTTLGNFIFTGLQTQNQAAVLIGCAAAAALAIGLDMLIRLLESASRELNLRRAVTAGAVLVVVLGVGLLPLFRSDSRSNSGVITVGAKTFTEQHVLAELLSKQFRKNGFRVATRPGLGSQIAFDALRAGAIDCYVDYSGTIWTNVMKRTDFPSRRQMLVEIKRYLAVQHGIVSAGRLGFENAYALAMPRALAEQLGIRSISDLAVHAPRLKLGGDVEFFGRPEWEKVREAYRLDFNRTVGMDASLMYEAARAGELDVIAAFSSDGRIAAFDLQVLHDDRSVFPPYDAIILVSRQAAGKPNIFRALQPLIESLDDDAMRMTNKLVDVDGVSPQDAASVLIRQLEENVSGGPLPGTMMTSDERPIDVPPDAPKSLAPGSEASPGQPTKPGPTSRGGKRPLTPVT